MIAHDTSGFGTLGGPHGGKEEGYLSLSYTWQKQRPHGWNLLHPKEGIGLNIKADWASEEVFGEYNYTRIKTDSYLNINLGGSLLYFRLKTLSSNGNLPPQDYIGLTEDQPFILMVWEISVKPFQRITTLAAGRVFDWGTG